MLASIAVISAITHRFNLPAIADAAKKLRCHEDELIRAMQPGPTWPQLVARLTRT